MVALAQLDLQSLFVGLYWMDLIDLEVLPDKLWDGDSENQILCKWVSGTNSTSVQC